MRKINLGFSLIELLVVISIMGVILALSIFGLQGANQSGRDTKRKADLSAIASSIEAYRSECNTYPLALSSPLVGTGAISSCPITNSYMTVIPTDPQAATHSYVYSSTGTTYELCASLENGGTTVTCGGSSNCGSATCNYKIVNP